MGLKIAAALLAILIVGLGASLVYGEWRWRTTTAEVAYHLRTSRVSSAGAIYDEAEIAGLPAPVQRYFRRILRPGQLLPAGAHIIHEGQFRMGEAEDRWRPFVSTEVFSTRPPGFVWDARIRMAPGLAVNVRDSYLAGEGAMRGEALALVPVVNAHGVPELAAGALQRYLAEAVWCPPALLPSRGVEWTAIDDSTARATLKDGATTVSIEFRFNAEGEITSAFTPARYREVKGRYEPTPWEGRFAKYEERSGLKIPLEAEVEWQLPGRRLPYWRGRITEAFFE
jgi:uncharacterized protein DUF6920